MEITDLIDRQNVIAMFRASGKARLLRELCERAARLTGLDGQAILRAVESREALGSTGVGQGVALPHARVPGLKNFFGLFAQLERPIAFEAIDERPVDLVFLLLIPQHAGDEHLAALACVSRLLRQRDIADALRAAKTGAEIYELLAASGHARQAV